MIREPAFVAERSERWKSFEQALEGNVQLPAGQLSELFVEVTDDLAYAQTFYPGSRTTAYLNALARRAHGALYTRRRLDRGAVARFWGETVPQALYEARRPLLVSLILFGLAVVVGWVSEANDDGYARLILGDQYVNMSIENIKSGDPMGVYKKMNEIDMFLGITINNVRVSLLAFAAGLLPVLGVPYVLGVNGFMVGAFQGFFAGEGLLGETARTIWIHGTLEIASIIVAGAAGLCITAGLLFPGTLTRLESFKRSVRRGAIIVIGLVPMFVVAGALEGFVTRHTDMPLVLALAIIGGSMAFNVWYFAVYPRRVGTQGSASILQQTSTA
ncbi:MAG: stage II sporulation protein M [Bacteroidota bacterium]